MLGVAVPVERSFRNAEEGGGFLDMRVVWAIDAHDIPRAPSGVRAPRAIVAGEAGEHREGDPGEFFGPRDGPGEDRKAAARVVRAAALGDFSPLPLHRLEEV